MGKAKGHMDPEDLIIHTGAMRSGDVTPHAPTQFSSPRRPDTYPPPEIKKSATDSLNVDSNMLEASGRGRGQVAQRREDKGTGKHKGAGTRRELYRCRVRRAHLRNPPSHETTLL